MAEKDTSAKAEKPRLVPAAAAEAIGWTVIAALVVSIVLSIEAPEAFSAVGAPGNVPPVRNGM